MSRYQRAAEITELAYVLLNEYHQGTPLHDLFREDEGPGDTDGAVLTIHVHAVGRDLSGLVASFDAIQLAFDAAAVAFAYDKAFPDQSPETLDYEVLQSFAFSPIGSLQIYDLYSGSFGGKFKAIFRDPMTRTGVSAVGGLTVIALHLICPLMIVPTAIIGGVGTVAPVASAIYDRILTKQEEAAKKQAGIKAKEAAKAKDEAAAERERRLENRIDILEQIIRKTGTTFVDTDAVLGAGAKATTKVTEVPPEAA